MIKVNQKVEVYEVDGAKVSMGKDAHIEVNSHSLRSQWVVITAGGMSYTVNGYDLIQAAKNATIT